MHFQYTVFGPLDEFHGVIQICYYECPHISGIYLESDKSQFIYRYLDKIDR